MSSRALPLVVGLTSCLVLAGCPSKDSSSSSGATSPSAASSASGPLAGLESAPAVDQTWTTQDGQALPMIFFSQQKVRLSAQCRQPNGQLACDALRQVREGAPVAVNAQELNAGISAGTKACRKLGQLLVSAHDAAGNEDGFCKFADGSMISTGALEQYGMQLTQ